jgi:hypothetical protein
VGGQCSSSDAKPQWARRNRKKYRLPWRLLCMQPVDIMALPYQCLVARNESTEAEVKWTLFGASGPKLVAQSSNGTTSVWPEQDGRVSVSNEHRLVS